MDDESVERADYNYQSSRSLNKEQTLRRRLENKDYVLKKKEKSVAVLQKEVSKLEEKHDAIMLEKKATDDVIDKLRSSLQAQQTISSQLEKDLNKEQKRRRLVEKQVTETQQQYKSTIILLNSSEEKNRQLQKQLDEQHYKIAQYGIETEESVARMKKLEGETVHKTRQLEEMKQQLQALNMRSISSSDAQVNLSKLLDAKTQQITALHEDLRVSKSQFDECFRSKNALQAELHACVTKHSSVLRGNDKLMKDLQVQNQGLSGQLEAEQRRVFLLEEDVKTLKSHVAVMTSLVESSKVAAQETQVKEYYKSEVHVNLKGKLVEANERLQGMEAALLARDQEIEVLQAKLKSSETSIFHIVKSKHDEIESKEASEVKRRQLSGRCTQLQAQVALLLKQLRGLETQLQAAKEKSLALKALFRVVLQENTELRGSQSVPKVSRIATDDMKVIESEDWCSCLEGILQQTFTRMYGVEARSKAGKKQEKKFDVELRGGKLVICVVPEESDEANQLAEEMLTRSNVNVFLANSCSQLDADLAAFIADELMPYLLSLLHASYTALRESTGRLATGASTVVQVNAKQEFLQYRLDRAVTTRATEVERKQQVVTRLLREVVDKADSCIVLDSLRMRVTSMMGSLPLFEQLLESHDSSSWFMSHKTEIIEVLKSLLNEPLREDDIPGKLEVQLSHSHVDDGALLGIIRVLSEDISPTRLNLPPMVTYIPSLQRLLLINLSNNQLTDASCATLSPLIVESTTVRMVDLRFNHITTEGRYILLDAVERNKGVTSVSHKSEAEMIEGVRSGASRPLRVDIRSNSPPAPGVSDYDEFSSAKDTSGVPVIVPMVSKKFQRPMSAGPMGISRRPESSNRRRILTAKKYGATAVMEDTEKSARDALDTFEVEGTAEDDCDLVINEALQVSAADESHETQEHLRRLRIIAGISGEQMDAPLNTTGASSAMNQPSSLNQPFQNLGATSGANSAVPKKARPVSAPVSRRIAVQTKHIYAAAPFVIENPPIWSPPKKYTSAASKRGKENHDVNVIDVAQPVVTIPSAVAKAMEKKKPGMKKSRSRQSYLKELESFDPVRFF